MNISKRTALAGLAGSLAIAGLAKADGVRRAAPRKGQLSNPGATSEARSLYRYLNSVVASHKTLTGQQASKWQGDSGPELDYLQKVSGRLPAVIGLDFIDPNRETVEIDHGTSWYKDNGGIVTYCWHWGNPMIGPGYEQAKTVFDIAAGLTPGTPENLAMMRDLDRVAGYLQILQNRGVPVLWRPFHEFTGTWFWWGKGGPELFKRLWVLMYDHFTHTRGLNNLIWVLGYSGSPKASYYPGRAYVDVVGADMYAKDHNALKPLYDAVVDIAGTDMPIVLHECGCIPDPDLLTASGANWAYFMTWSGHFVLDGLSNSADFIRTAYNSDRYITRDEIPPLGFGL